MSSMIYALIYSFGTSSESILTQPAIPMTFWIVTVVAVLSMFSTSE